MNWHCSATLVTALAAVITVVIADNVTGIYRVVVATQSPFVENMCETDANGVKTCTEGAYQGYCIDLLAEIKKVIKIPFEYEIYITPDGSFGALKEDGTWSGMIGELVAKKADLALASLSVTAERESVVDFTVPYYDLVGITILMRRPDTFSSLFEFMRVLEMPLWICIIAAYFVVSLMVYFLDKVSPNSYTNNKDLYKDDPHKREFTFRECLWYALTSLTPHSGGIPPKNISGRLVGATWWLFGFIAIASYTSNLAAFLTVSQVDSEINSIDDLYRQSKIKYGPVKGGSTGSYFAKMADIESRFYDLWKDKALNDTIGPDDMVKKSVFEYPVSDKFTNLWRFMRTSDLPTSGAEGFERVLASSQDKNGDSTTIQYGELTDCRLKKVGPDFSKKPFAIAVQQNSPIKDAISSAILQLLNDRQLEKLREKWWTNNVNKAECKKDEQSDGIAIKNIGGVFIVILCGIVVSIIVMIFEFYYRKEKATSAESSAVNEQPMTEYGTAGEGDTVRVGPPHPIEIGGQSYDRASVSTQLSDLA